jgi:O-antigen/teichoic acid export membrane protein
MNLANFSGSPHKKKYLINTLWVFGGFILRYGVNMIVSVYLARYLQPEGFGVLSYASTFLQLLSPLALMGLYGIITRELVRGEHDEKVVMGTAFYLKLTASVATTILIIIIAQFTESESSDKWNILIASASLLVSPFGVIDFFFQAKVQSKYIVYSQQAAYLITSAIRVLLIVWQAPVYAFVIMIFADAFLAALGLLFYYNLQGFSVKTWRFDKELSKIIMKEVPKVMFADFFIVLYMKIDQVMIDKMLGSTDLGIYSAAVKLCEPFYMVATLLLASLFPAIVNGMKISIKEYRHRLQRLFNVLTWLAIFVSIIVTLFSEFIINTLFDTAFASAAPVLALYFWSSVFIFQGTLASQAYMVEKKQQYSLYYTLVGATINIGLNFYFIPNYGLIGSCWATLISYACSATLMNAVSKATFNIFVLQMHSFIAIFTKPQTLSVKSLLKNKNN